MMKRLLKNIALMAVAAISVVSCAESDFDKSIPTTENGTVIYAKTAPTNQTKVDFTDKGTDGIALEWVEGDSFIIYDDQDAEVGKFSCTDAEKGKFVANDGVTLTDGATYRAEYGSKDELYTPNGDEINNLDAACYMVSDDFTYSEGKDLSIAFKHQMAIITFKFASENRPAKLVFENGNDTYTVKYSTLEPTGGVYISHIMVEPCEATNRTLTFSLYSAEDDLVPYDVRTTTTSFAYQAGYRYTATVSDLEDITWEGDGSKTNPYKITSTEQLRLLATNVNNGTTYEGKYFELTKNIDLNGSEDNQWTPIGYGSLFMGTFDGTDKTISGLYINSTSGKNGLFGEIKSATIKNLTISGEVTGTEFIGGIAGGAYFSSSITNCINKVAVTGSVANVGGIVGYCYKSSITNSSNEGTVNGESNYTGGIAGQILDTSTLSDCYNNGSVNGTQYTGGIVGYTGDNDIVTKCYNKAKILGTSDVGGIAGLIFTTITNCYNIGEVSATQYRAGGIVGCIDEAFGSEGSVVNCYNRGVISALEVAGGIAGVSSGEIINCYNASEISGNANIGSITGYSLGNIENCYFDCEIFTGNGVGGGGKAADQITIKETSEMKSVAFVILLNNGAYSYNESTAKTEACAWVIDDSFPTFDYDGTPEYAEPAEEVTVAEIQAANYPDSDSWIITDSEISAAALKDIISSDNLGERLISIHLPNVTTLNNDVFKNCDAIKAVSAPKVVAINAYTFCQCSALESVSFPKVTLCGDAAFGKCSSLNSVSLPVVESLGNVAFSECSKLVSISLPKATSLGSTLFTGCSELKSASIPTVTTLEPSIFSGCRKMESIDLSSLSSFSNGSFSSFPILKEINLPSIVTLVGNFAGATGLEKITMENLETIDMEAGGTFSGLSNLYELNVPKLHTINAGGVFGGNTSLTTIKLPSLKIIPKTINFDLDFIEYLDISAPNLTIADRAYPFSISEGTSTECELVLNSDQKENVTNGNVWSTFTLSAGASDPAPLTWGSITFTE